MIPNNTTLNPPGAALLYSDGEWHELPEDPIAKLYQRDGDAVPLLAERAQYQVFTNARHQDRAPLGMTVYRANPGRHDVPAWLLVLEAPPYGEGDAAQHEYVYARSLPDVMAVVGVWTPVLHSLASFEVAALELVDFEPDDPDDPDTPT